MAGDDDLKVHDVRVSTEPVPTPNGFQKKTKVTYFIGNHGPFMDQYEEAEGTAETIRMGIQKQVDLLRQVTLGYS